MSAAHDQGLEAACAETARSLGDIARDVLGRQALPFGEAAGKLTDDDVFAAF